MSNDLFLNPKRDLFAEAPADLIGPPDIVFERVVDAGTLGMPEPGDE